jgi:hypothetical protein
VPASPWSKQQKQKRWLKPCVDPQRLSLAWPSYEFPKKSSWRPE